MLLSANSITFAFRIKYIIYMSALIAFILFVAVALLGWGLAELKNKSCTYTHSEEEREEAEVLHKILEDRNFRELNLKDLLAHNSTKGFSAV
uniref:Uncharacterized protein n=1 Tax=Prevotella sp. GTC17254 TaxID=3236794 RepID=A0AB33IYW6_9BACT